LNILVIHYAHYLISRLPGGGCTLKLQRPQQQYWRPGINEFTMPEDFPKGPGKNNFHILGTRIWVGFVRSGGGKTGGIASSFEDFDTPGAGEDGLKPGWIKGEIIFSRVLKSTNL
jgi:hypothetical protein